MQAGLAILNGHHIDQLGTAGFLFAAADKNNAIAGSILHSHTRKVSASLAVYQQTNSLSGVLALLPSMVTSCSTACATFHLYHRREACTGIGFDHTCALIATDA